MIATVQNVPMFFLHQADYDKRVGSCPCGASEVLVDSRGYCLPCRTNDQAERIKEAR